MPFASNATRDSNWIAMTALSLIGATSVDNPPSANDLSLALDRLDVVAQNLADRGVFYQPDIDITPASVAIHFAQSLALAIKADFGNQTPPGQDNIPTQDMIDRFLKRIDAEATSYGPQKVSFF